MSNARNLARLIVDSGGDVDVSSLGNVPPSNDASALTTGTLPVGRLPSSGVDASSLTTGSLGTARLPAGSVIQVVSAHHTNHTQYASADYQATSTQVSITPKRPDSKFLVRASMYGGVENHDVAVGFSFYDSLISTSSPIVADNQSGGSPTNGGTGHRMGAFFGITSWASDSLPDDWFIGTAVGEYLYTPSYQNVTTRTFGVLVKTSYGYWFRENMGQRNAVDPRDMRVASQITVMEIAP